MTIQSIIKKAIKRLELEGKLLTPDFYAEAFCKEATKANMMTEDCNQITKFTKTLTLSEIKETFKNKIIVFTIKKDSLSVAIFLIKLPSNLI